MQPCPACLPQSSPAVVFFLNPLSAENAAAERVGDDFGSIFGGRYETCTQATLKFVSVCSHLVLLLLFTPTADLDSSSRARSWNRWHSAESVPNASRVQSAPRAAQAAASFSLPADFSQSTAKWQHVLPHTAGRPSSSISRRRSAISGTVECGQSRTPLVAASLVRVCVMSKTLDCRASLAASASPLSSQRGHEHAKQNLRWRSARRFARVYSTSPPISAKHEEARGARRGRRRGHE